MGSSIPYILDGGDCHVGIESTIIGFKEDRPEVFRLGGISIEEIEEVIGNLTIRRHSSSRPATPGSLESHYSPGKKVFLEDVQCLKSTIDLSRTGYIRFQEPYPGIPINNQVILSRSGSLKEAAKNLFSALRIMDERAVDYVIAELLPEEGLGRAINDRLRRASAIN